jgi:hypothetical protein
VRGTDAVPEASNHSSPPGPRRLHFVKPPGRRSGRRAENIVGDARGEEAARGTTLARWSFWGCAEEMAILDEDVAILDEDACHAFEEGVIAS